MIWIRHTWERQGLLGFQICVLGRVKGEHTPVLSSKDQLPYFSCVPLQVETRFFCTGISNVIF